MGCECRVRRRRVELDIFMDNARNYQPAEIAMNVVRYCLSTNKKLIFISGNGGSGKTELSKIITQEAGEHGRVNVLSMDDFVVDTQLRNGATAKWLDMKKGEQTGRFTTSLAASYFLPSVKAIIFNLEKGNNYYHWPKKAQMAEECRLLYGDAVLTIIEGVGTVFLEKDSDRSLSIFLQCQPEIEMARRVKRGKFSNEQSGLEVHKSFAERNSQYRTMVEPHKIEHGLVLESLEDFSISVIRDDDRIFRSVPIGCR